MYFDQPCKESIIKTENALLDAAPRRGLTLVELLAVVAIIGVLIMLLLPAVQAAREAARRASCTSNITQLIMSVHNYEDAHRVYPPGSVNPSGPVLNQLAGYHHGWIEHVLPYLEKEVVYHGIDRTVGVYHKANRPVRKLAFSWLICPSSPQPSTGYSNYAALQHDLEASIDVDQNGVFFLNSRIAPQDVSDGVAYTIFVGEKILEPGDLGWLSGTRAILRNTGDPINKIGQSSVWGTVPMEPIGVSGPVGSPYDMSMGGSMSEMGMVSGETEEFAELDDDSEAVESEVDLDAVLQAQGRLTPRSASPFVGGFASFHPGGANFAMGDGSNRFVATTIAEHVYRQLGHRADGQLVELD